MAIDNLQNSNDQNPLSGPYIRSIVKQLTKQPNLNPTHKNLFLNNNDTLILPNYPNIPMTSTSKTNTTTTTRKQAMARPSNQRDHAQGHKKQVRRRLHTSRPYQERLLNMAEARKEIVTALKYHRASMKQANDRKQAQQNDRQQVELQQVLGRDYYESSRKVKSEHLSVDNYGNCYPSDFNNNNNNNHNYNQNYCSASNTSTSPSNEPTSILYESLHNIPLPNQTLGLNLNLQSFTNLDTKLCHRINTTSTITTTTTNTNNYPSSITTSPSSSSSSLSNSSGVTAITTGAEGVGPTSGNNMNSGMDMHPTLDQEEIAKMRSIGEQYQIEWDDTLNLVKSARWFKFLKTADYGKEMKESYYNNGYDNLPFGELMEIPPWLSPINDDESFLQQHLDDSCSDDTTLPWMDIGDIDAMDDEWLSKDSAV